MKRIIPLAAAILLLFTLCACGTGANVTEFSAAPGITTEAVCNVLCMNGEGVTVDGVAYSKADFPDNTGFCVATYYENGEKQVLALGVDE